MNDLKITVLVDNKPIGHIHKSLSGSFDEAIEEARFTIERNRKKNPHIDKDKLTFAVWINDKAVDVNNPV